MVQPLLLLQEIDGRIRHLEKELNGLPLLKQEALDRLAVAEKAVQDAKQVIAHKKAHVSDLEADIAERRSRLEKLKEGQGNLRAGRDFSAMGSQVDRLEREVVAILDQQETTQGGVDPSMDALVLAEKSLADTKDFVDSDLAEIAEREVMFKAEIEEAMKERITAIVGVPVPMLTQYDRLRTRRWPCVTRFNLQTGVCSGCNLVQPPSVTQMVRRNQAMVHCQSCGRILFSDDRA